MRGVDSHGAFVRIPPLLSALQQGKINPKPSIKVIKENLATGLIDGDNGFGQIVAMKACDMAVEKAKTTDVGIVGARNTGHVGILAHYTLKIVNKDLVGMATTSARAHVVPWGGTKGILGTNPFSIAFPLDNKKSILVDMSTSIVSGGKIAMFAAKGEKIPEGWALDKNGKPTTDPKIFLDDGLLLPFGAYKGYSLSMSIEVLAGVLTGSPLAVEMPLTWAVQGGFMVEALDIEAFRTKEEYAKEMLRLMKLIKTCPPAEGFSEVLLPGEIEEREYQERLRN
jgi:LDH2 family malate/lactate/ureidoglycolate dehydrogenase